MNIWRSFKLHCALWILALHKTKLETARPQTKKTVTIFLLDVNENQLMLWMNQLFEHHTCIFYSSVAITM